MRRWSRGWILFPTPEQTWDAHHVPLPCHFASPEHSNGTRSSTARVGWSGTHCAWEVEANRRLMHPNLLVLGLVVCRYCQPCVPISRPIFHLPSSKLDRVRQGFWNDQDGRRPSAARPLFSYAQKCPFLYPTIRYRPPFPPFP